MGHLCKQKQIASIDDGGQWRSWNERE